jgi:hypothetical protein
MKSRWWPAASGGAEPFIQACQPSRGPSPEPPGTAHGSSVSVSRRTRDRSMKWSGRTIRYRFAGRHLGRPGQARPSWADPGARAKRPEP